MLTKATIALVDDNKMIRELLGQILKDEGFIVHAFGCPTELLSSAALAEADCLLTDLDMPIMNGCKLQANVTRRRPELPVVFITGSDDEDQRQLALDQGAFAYLKKPARLVELVAVLHDAKATLGCCGGSFRESFR